MITSEVGMALAFAAVVILVTIAFVVLQGGNDDDR